jgi:MFS transporter, UMF1 family
VDETSRPTRRSTWSWVVYDLANTIFALGVLGYYFPAWLTEEGLPDAALAVTVSVGGAVVAFLAPWVGARSDARARRVPTLVVTTVVAVAATAALAWGPAWTSLVALGVALVAFNTGSVVYDALLPDVSTPATRGSVSGMGIGVGYVGSFVGLAIGVVTLDLAGLGYPATFTALAAAFLLFALPAFFFIEERPRPLAPPPAPADVLRRLVRSWRLARTVPGMARFLVGRFLYTDAINTLIGGFLAIYAIQELGLDEDQTRLLLVLAIATAIPGGLIGGLAVNRLGGVRVLRAVLASWVVALAVGVAAGAAEVVWPAWLLGPLGGAALGATWAADRVVMNDLSPPGALGEMYGLYATVGRFATILGPLVWALVVDVAGLGRTWALGTLALFVATALVVIGGLERDPQMRRVPAA